MTLALASTSTIDDLAGNTMTVRTAVTNETYEVDNTLPTLTSIARKTPAGQATNADTLIWSVTFSEDVTGVADADFSVAALSGASIAVAPDGSSKSVYDVTVTSGDLAEFEGTVTLALAGSSTIDDLAGNTMTARTAGTGETYEVDNTLPTLTSIARKTPAGQATNADTLIWSVTFSEDVTGVADADFSVAALSGASIAVAPDGGSKSVYDVTVTGGDLAEFEGTVTLALDSKSGMDDLSGNALTNRVAGTSETYEVDNTAPTVAINGVPANTNGPFNVTVVFSESVTGFVEGDLLTSHATVSSFAGSGDTYTATITPTGASVSVSITANVARDAAGNDNTGASEISTYDNTPPTVSSIARKTPSGQNTNVDTLIWSVTFSEDVMDVDNADFSVSGLTGSPTIAVAADGGSKSVYDVTVSGANLAEVTGTVSLALAGSSTINDLADNALTNRSVSSGETYEVDNTAPTVTITGVPASSNAAFTATFTFSEAVTGFALGDITLGNGVAGDFVVDSETTYSATITPTGASVTVKVNADAATDAAGNGNEASDTSTSTYSTDAPTVTITGVPAATNAAFTVTFTFSEAVTGFAEGDITVVNGVAGSFTGSGTTYNAEITPNAEGAVTVSVASGVAMDTDSNGNEASNTLTSNYDITAPTVAISNVPVNTNAAFMATFTFSEAVTGFALGDIVVTNGAASALTGSGSSYGATITPAAEGDVTVKVNAGVATDAADNGNEVSTISTSNYDTTLPTVSSIARKTPSGQATNADTLIWSVTFSEDVTGVADDDFAVAALSGAGITVTPDGSSKSVYDVTVTGGDLAEFEGPVSLTLDSGSTIDDLSGNALTARTADSSESYDLDNTAPRIASITRLTPTRSPTSADTLTWRVTFNELVSGVDSADFSVTGTGLGTPTVTVLADSGNAIYDVTATDGNLAEFNSTVTLGVSASHGITDRVSPSNALVNRTPQGTNDNTYTVENIKVTVSGGVDVTEGSNAVFTLTATPAPSAELTVRIEVADDDTSDFVNSSNEGTQTVTIPTGGSATYNVVTEGDSTDEANGEVTVTVLADTTSPSTYTVGTSGSDTVTVNDDDNVAPTVANSIADQTRIVGFNLVYSFPLNTFEDLDGDDLTYSSNAGSISWLNFDASTRTFSGTPPDTETTVSVEVTASDGTLSVTDTFTFILVDIINPWITSITRRTPGSSPTSADTLTWRVTFNEPVSGVDSADFSVTGTGLGTPTVRVLADSGNAIYDVTATSGNLADFNGTVTLGILSSHGITDRAGTPNVLRNLVPFDVNENTYVLENIKVTVSGGAAVTEGSNAVFTLTATPSPLSDLTVRIQVADDGTSDFVSTSNEGTQTVTITSVGTAVYNVATEGDSTDEAHGMVTVTVLADTASPVTYEAGSPASDTVTVNDDENVAPRVANPIADQTTTAGASFSYIVPSNTFEDTDGDDLTYRSNASGWLSFDVGTRTFSGTAPLTGTTVSVDVTASDGSLSIKDTFIISVTDNMAPRIASITRRTPTSSPTNADSLTWRVTFNEPVTGVNAGDFSVSGRGLIGSIVSVVADSGNAIYDVTARGGNLATVTATVTLGIVNNHGITDLAPTPNALVNLVPQGTHDNSYAVTNILPVISISGGTGVTEGSNAVFTLRATPAPLSALTVHLQVADDATSDFVSSSNEGTKTVTIPTGGMAVYNVATEGDSTDEANGAVTVKVLAENNMLVTTHTGPATYGVGHSKVNGAGAGIATVAVADDDNGVPTVANAIADQRIAVSAAYSYTFPTDTFEDPDGDSLSYSSPAAGTGDWLTFDAGTRTFSGTAPGTGETVTVTVTASDSALSVTDTFTLTVTAGDVTAPTVTFLTRITNGSLAVTDADTLSWRIIFSEAVTGVDATDFIVSDEHGGLVRHNLTVTPVNSNAYGLEASGGNLADFNGKVILSFAPDQNIQDTAGNPLTPPSEAPSVPNGRLVTLDNSPPVVYIEVLETYAVDPDIHYRMKDQPTGETITFPVRLVRKKFKATITFEETVDDFDLTDLTVTGGTASTLRQLKTDDKVYTVLITPTGASGTVTVQVNADAVTDGLGRGNVATSIELSYDSIAPTLTSIVRQRPSFERVSLDTLSWRLTFSEPVVGLDAGDFRLTGTTAKIASVFIVGAAAPEVEHRRTGRYDNTQWEVRISGGNLERTNGKVTLLLKRGSTITDRFGNRLVAREPTGTNEDFYTLDNRRPRVTISGVPATSSGAFTATFTFTELLVGGGLTREDLIVTNADVSEFKPVSGANAYTALISPRLSGAVSVTVRDSIRSDPAGNLLRAPDDPAVSTYTPPGSLPVITVSGGSPTSKGRNAVFTVTATPPPSSPLQVRIRVSDDSANDFVAGSNEGVKTVTIPTTGSVTYSVATQSGSDGTGEVTVTVLAGRATTATYLPSAREAVDTVNVVDNAPPTVANAIADQTVTIGAAYSYIFPANTFEDDGSLTYTSNAGSISWLSFDAVTRTFSGTAPGTEQTVEVTVTASDGTSSVSDTFTLSVVDTIAPTVTITGVPAATNAAFTATFTFSESVTGFVVGDITVTNGNAGIGSFTGVGTTYMAEITPDTEGDVTVSVAAGVAVDVASNGNTASNTLTSNYDITAPTVAISNVPANTNAAFTATFTFSEAVTGFVVGDIVVTNGAAGVLTGSGSSYGTTITPNGEGNVTVKVNADVAADAANNGNTASTTSTSNYDTTLPTVTSITRKTPAGQATNADTLVWSVTFSEDVTGVADADFSVSGLTGSPTIEVAADGGSQSVYDVTVSGANLAGVTGTVSLALDSSSTIDDLSGNTLTNRTAGSSETYEVDNTLPTLTSIARKTPAGQATNADTLVWSVTFSEDVTGVAAADFSVSGLTGSPTIEVAPDSGSQSAYDVTVTGGNLASVTGTVSLALDSGSTIDDLVGNTMTVRTAGTSETYEVDNTAPTVAINGVPANTNGPFDVTIVFSESVTGFVMGELLTSNAGVSSFAGSGDTYTATITPTGASVSVSITANVAEDAAGNGNTGASEISTYDNTPPTVDAIVRKTPSGQDTNADTLIWSVTFSEAVTGVTAADFSVSGLTGNPTIEVAADGVSQSVYDVTVNGANLAGVTGTVSLALDSSSTIDDLAGNTMTVRSVGSSEDYDVDNTRPTVTINGVPDNVKNTPFVVTVKFSETVNDFIAGEIKAAGATVGEFAGSGRTYSARITPTGGASVTVSIDANAAQDDAGNGNTGASETSTYDNTPPTVDAIARKTPAGQATNADTLVWRVTFSEDVMGVADADFSVAALSGASIRVAPDGSSKSVYDVTVTGGNLAEFEGTVTLALAGSSTIDDLVGNTMTVRNASSSETYEVDNTLPTLTSIARKTPAGQATNADTLVWSVTFSEDVTGVAAADFSVSGLTGSPTIEVAADGVSKSVYDVTVSGANLAGVTGTVSLALDSSSTIDDLSGNTLTARTASSSETYEVDNTLPTLTSIARKTPAGQATNADTLVWRVTFSEDVTGVAAADFSVSGLTGSPTIEVAADGVSKSVYDVTVTGGNLAGVTGTVSLALDSSSTIDDLSGNTLTARTAGSSETYEVDNTLPTLTSIARKTPAGQATNADTLVWSVTFSEDVTGVAAADFSVSGLTGSPTIEVAADGVSKSVYDVTVTGGNLAGVTGTVSLALDSSSTIDDLSGNTLTARTAGSSETYEVDNTLPTLTSIARKTPANQATNADTLIWRVTFSEDVTGVAAADFSVSGLTGSPTIEVAADGGSQSVYNVTVSGGNLAGVTGTVSLALDSSSTIDDLSGNTLTARTAGSGETYEVDNTLPTLTSIARKTPSNQATNANTLVWRVTFSEDVTGVTDADFSVAALSGASIRVAPDGSSKSVYDVTVTGGDLADFEGTVTLTLAGSSSMNDLAGNTLTARTASSSETYELKNLAPTVDSIVRKTPSAGKTSADTLIWRVTFSRDVTGVAADDFAVAALSGASIRVAPDGSSKSVYDVTVTGGDLAGFEGTVSLTLKSGSTIDDLSGNALTDGTAGSSETYEVDNTLPTLTSIARKTPAGQATNADTLIWSVTFSEDVTGVADADFSVSGLTGSPTISVTADGGSQSVYDVTVTGGNLAGVTGTVSLALDSSAGIDDLAGNTLTVRTAGSSETYEVDNTLPTLTSIARKTPAGQATNADTLVWRVTFSEDVTGVAAADFSVSGLTGSPTISVTADGGSQSVYDVTVNDGNLAGVTGTVSLALDSSSTIDDLAGNTLTARTADSSETYEVDNTLPTLTSIARKTPAGQATNANTLVWRVTFSEDVTGVADADFSVAALSGASIRVAPDGSSKSVYDVTVTSGNLAGFTGTVTLALASGSGIDDLVGNTMTNRTAGLSETYEVDNTLPTLTSIARKTPAGQATNADTLVWRVTFSEDVTGVTAADFSVSGLTGSPTIEVAADGVSKSVYDVTVTGGNLAGVTGTVSLALDSSSTIDDLSGNTLTARTAGSSETYEVDNTLPTLTSIARKTPSNQATNANTLVWSVTFSEDVTGVAAADFSVSGLTGSPTISVTADGGSKSVYDVTVTGGNLAGVTGTVSLALDSSSSIDDLSGNTLTARTAGSSETYEVDNTLPTLTSIARKTPSNQATNANTLVWRVTFSEDVTGVADADFSVAALSGASIRVAPDGSSKSVYDVTVTGGDLAGFEGTVTLTLAGSSSMNDLAGNTLTARTASSSETYELKNSAPTVDSIVRKTPSAGKTSADTLIWRVTFSEDVTGVAADDFAVAALSGASIRVAPDGSSKSVYDVTVTGGDLAGFEGTVSLTLKSGLTIDDLSGNALTDRTASSSESYDLDNTAPRIASITRLTPTRSPTSADTLTWRVTFNEPVSGVAAGDFSVTGTGLGTPTVRVLADSGNAIYDVTATGGNLAEFNSTVTLGVSASHGITDRTLPSNALVNRTPQGTNDNTYAVENIKVTVSGGVDVTEGSNAVFTLTATPAPSADLTVRIEVADDDTSDFVNSSNEGTQTVTIPTGGSATYNVVTEGDSTDEANGEVTVTVLADTTSPSTYTVGTSGSDTVTVNDDDNGTPILANTIDDQSTTVGVSFRYAVPSNTFEDLDGDDLTYTSNAGSIGWLSFNASTRTFSGTAPDTETTVSVEVTASDGTLSVTDSFIINVIDNIAPRITSITRLMPTSSPTNADSLTWRVTFNEPVSGVDSADFSVTGTGLGSHTLTVVADSGNAIYDVTATGGNLAGFNDRVTLGIVGSPEITDRAGAPNALANQTPLGTNDNSYTLDNTAPTVAITGVPATGNGAFTARFTFSESVTGFTSEDLIVTNADVSEFQSAGTNVYTALIAPRLSGEVSVTVKDSGSHDEAGNALPAPARPVTSTYTPPDSLPVITISGGSDTSKGRNAVFTLTATPPPTLPLQIRIRVLDDSTNDFVGSLHEGIKTVTIPITGSVTYSVATKADRSSATGELTVAVLAGEDTTAKYLPDATTAVDTVSIVANLAPTVANAIANQKVNIGEAFSYSFPTTTFEDLDGDSLTYTSNAGSIGWLSFNASTRTFSGTAPNTEATVSVEVIASDGSLSVTDTFIINVIDNIAPQITSITRLAPTRLLTHADSLTWRVTFDEPVTGVNSAAFSVSGTSLGNPTITIVADSGNAIYDVTARGGNLAGFNDRVTLGIVGSHGITDRAGVPNALVNRTPLGTNDNSYTLDNTAPTVAITGVPASGNIPFNVTITFSEVVSGFVRGDIAVTNATTSSFVADSGTVYRATITPSSDGGVTVSVNANVAQDVAGNGNIAMQETSTYDIMAPRVASITRESPTSEDTNANSLTWLVTFNEAVTGVDRTDFSVDDSISSLISSVAPVGASVTIYAVTTGVHVLAEHNDTVTLTLADTPTIQDIAGNVLTDGTPLGTNDNSFNLDNIAPTLTISVPENNSVAFEATFTFSEAVTGFTLTDITVGNGTPSGFITVSDDVYRATITPDAEGPVRVTVGMDAFEDTAGNMNELVTQASSIHRKPALILTPSNLTVGEGATATYTVALATEPIGGKVTVAVMMSGESADVTVETTPLEFTASDWQIGKPVRVSAGLDENLTDENVTLTHTAKGADYESLEGTVAVTVKDTTSMSLAQSAFLSRFGRLVGQQTVDAVADRLSANRRAGLTGELAGHALPKMTGEVNSTGAMSDGRSSVNLEHLEEIERILSGVEGESTGTGESGRLTSDELLTGTSFALNLKDGKGASYALWGRGAYSGFESVEGDLKLDAEVSSYMLGADWKRESYLLGLMLSHSKGEGDYRYFGNEGEIETKLTALIPYFGWDVTDRIRIWTSVGFGAGTFSVPEDFSLTTDIDWQMLAGGSSGELGSVPNLGNARLSWRTDAFWTHTGSEGVLGLAPVEGDSMRLRFGLESRWENRLVSGAKWTHRLECGLRYDGGDAETGYGVEIGGGVDWADPISGFEMGIEGRTLTLHADDDLKEWGLAFKFAYDSSPQSKQGFRAHFSHDFGGTSSGGVAALLDPDLLSAGSGGTDDTARAWQAELAYGLGRSDGRVGLPYTRLSGGRSGFGQMRLGYRIEPDALSAIDMTLDVWAEPEIEPDDSDGSAAGVELKRSW